MSKHRSLRELGLLVVFALALALVIKTFAVQAFSIPSESMERTLGVGDRILVNKLVYRVRAPERGEIVVFDGRGTFIGIPARQDYVKRVIAIAGDRVACCFGGRLTILRPGTNVPMPLDETYVYQDSATPFCAAGTGTLCPEGAPGVLVPAGRLWVMGDHRNASGDSRFNRGPAKDGTIEVNQVIGRAFVIAWPLSRAGRIGSGVSP